MRMPHGNWALSLFLFLATCLPIQEDFSSYPNSAPSAQPVTIVEFADFECSFCAQQAADLRKLQAEYRSDVILIFKDFPLNAHRNARAAHRAARAAQKQGKFWEMHDLLFAHSGNLSPLDLDNFAKQLALDMDKFHQDTSDPATDAAIDKDIAEGKKLAIHGTPTLFVNGHELMGVQSYDVLKRFVEAQLRGESWSVPSP